jgi:hypothetical protein
VKGAGAATAEAAKEAMRMEESNFILIFEKDWDELPGSEVYRECVEKLKPASSDMYKESWWREVENKDWDVQQVSNWRMIPWLGKTLPLYIITHGERPDRGEDVRYQTADVFWPSSRSFCRSWW